MFCNSSWAHIDPAYCTYAFAYCVGRTLFLSEEISPSPIQPDSGSIHGQKSTSDTKTASYPPGSSFVDASLRVVVKQSVGTAMSFQPAYLHGTSIGHGASNAIISITFTQRVADAWAEMRAQGTQVSILTEYSHTNMAENPTETDC